MPVARGIRARVDPASSRARGCDNPRFRVSVTPPSAGPPASAPPGSSASQRGPLIAIGGAEDKVGDRAILRLVCERGGGKNARIAIFPTASSIPNEMAPLYEQIFRSFGARAATVWVDQRSDAE